MKILWVKSDFLHPATRGGQIRTLEMLRRVRRRHEVHYVGFSKPGVAEELARAPEYCTRAWPVEHDVPPHRSLKFAAQLAAGLWSPLPVAVGRYRSAAMRRRIDELAGTENFDARVCDFLAPAVNLGDRRGWILFQHNIETTIWRRHAGIAGDPVRRGYLGLQARRMFEFERQVCRSVRHVIAVSPVDARNMAEMFGLGEVSAVATGVDIDYFAPPPAPAPVAELVFLGSMDWLPNIDGVSYFVREILPLIRARRPDCRLAIVGKEPAPSIRALAADPRIAVTGTVPDVRPYLWGSAASVVPLRIGGGTRLKIYESMAARVPVVSTTIGAEGLEIHPPEDIRIADEPARFAAECLALLDNEAERRRQAEAAWRLVSTRFSWDRVALDFEAILERHASGDPGGRGSAKMTRRAQPD